MAYLATLQNTPMEHRAVKKSPCEQSVTSKPGDHECLFLYRYTVSLTNSGNKSLFVLPRPTFQTNSTRYRVVLSKRPLTTEHTHKETRPPTDQEKKKKAASQ